MTIADQINTISANVTALQTAVAALTAPAAIDLTPVTTAIATVKADTGAILADLTPTPVA